jgi:hypothetical protein
MTGGGNYVSEEDADLNETRLFHLLPRTTERPAREHRSTQRLSTGGDSPREIISSVETLKTALAPIYRGKCSELPARAVP